MPKRCRQENIVDEDENLAIPSRIIARRRKSRRPAVTTLPDHVREQLVEAFGNVDIQGEGRVNRFKLLEIVKEVYQPTERAVSNVERHLSRQLRCTELDSGRHPSFKSFVTVFSYIVLPVLSGVVNDPQLSWGAARDIFNMCITQTARHGPPVPHTGCDVALKLTELYTEELSGLYTDILTKSLAHCQKLYMRVGATSFHPSSGQAECAGLVFFTLVRTIKCRWISSCME